MQDKNSSNTLTRVVFSAVMAAIICVVTIFRIPLGQSKVHFANAMCLLSGLLLGPVWGGAAAGLGSALYDVMLGGYDFINALITFVSKFAMAWVAGMIFGAMTRKHAEGEPGWRDLPALAVSCVTGALTYVALYMLKTWIFKLYVEPVPADTLPTVLTAKLIPSLINAAFAIVVTPIFYHALLPALRGSGLLKKIRG